MSLAAVDTNVVTCGIGCLAYLAPVVAVNPSAQLQCTSFIGKQLVQVFLALYRHSSSRSQTCCIYSTPFGTLRLRTSPCWLTCLLKCTCERALNRDEPVEMSTRFEILRVRACVPRPHMICSCVYVLKQVSLTFVSCAFSY